MVERRRDLRAVVRLDVEPGGRTKLRRPPFFVSGNISVGGMFLLTTDPLPEGTEIKIKFRLPDSDSPIDVTGKVVWARGEGERPPFKAGMGLKFIKIKKKDKERIRVFVDEQLKKENKSGL